MQFLLMVLGLAQANSSHAWIWCIIHSEDRYVCKHKIFYATYTLYMYNMSKDAEERTIESIKRCAKVKSRSAKLKLGVK